MLSLFSFIFNALSFMPIYFSVMLSWLENSLLSLLIEYFFFYFLCVFTNCRIQSVVMSKYFFNPIVLVLLVNSD